MPTNTGTTGGTGTATTTTTTTKTTMATLEVPPPHHHSIDQHQQSIRSLSELYLSTEEYHHPDLLSAQLLANLRDQLQHNQADHHHYHHYSPVSSVGQARKSYPSSAYPPPPSHLFHHNSPGSIAKQRVQHRRSSMVSSLSTKPQPPPPPLLLDSLFDQQKQQQPSISISVVPPSPTGSTNSAIAATQHHHLRTSRSGSYLDQLQHHLQQQHHNRSGGGGTFFSTEHLPSMVDLTKSFDTKSLNEQEATVTETTTTTVNRSGNSNGGSNSKHHDGTYDGGTSSTTSEYGTTSSGGGGATKSNSIGNRSNRSTKGSTTTTTVTIRDWQKKLYDFLNHPNNLSAILYHIALLLMFVIYIMLIIFTDRTTWARKCKLYLVEPDFKDEPILTLKSMFEDFLILYFVVFEYCARLFASRSQSYYEKLPAWKWIVRYHFRVSHLFDLILACASIVVASCFITLPLDCTQDVYALIVLRGLHRLFNVAQWSSIHARHSPWSLMVEVFQEQGHMLFGIFYMELLLVLGMAYAVFLAEKHTAEKPDDVTIKDMFEALYWSSITLITIGYGDKAPVTILGKAITSLGIMIGLGLFALPSGIIATSLAIKLNEQDEIRSRSERRVLAATLIQRVWRFKRRQKRFELASLILNSSRYEPNPPPQLQPQQSTAENPTNEQSSSPTTPKVPVIVYVVEPLNIRIDGRLFEKIEQLYARRYEFYRAQFLELCQIQVARRKFAQLLKRHNQPFANSRRLIKAHWLEHRQLTELLEVMHQKLDQYYQTFEQQQHSSVPTLEQIECRLAQLHQRLVVQKQCLAKMNQLNLNIPPIRSK